MEANKQSYRAAKRVFLAERRAKVSELYKQGWTERKIAAELGCGLTTVSGDIHALIEEWKQRASINMAAHYAVMMAKLDADEAKAEAAYERSRIRKRIAKATQQLHPLTGETITLASATEIERDEGDPRFLMVELRCIDLRCKLIGLYGKAQAESIDQKRAPTTFAEFVAMHHEKLEHNGGNGSTAKTDRPSPLRLDPKRLP